MFEPTLATPPKDSNVSLGADVIEEVWFSGSHSDIGGGWPVVDEQLSDIPLLYMLQRASAQGMIVNLGVYDDLTQSAQPTGTEELHRRLKKSDGKVKEIVNKHDPREIQVLRWDGKFDVLEEGGRPKIHHSVVKRIAVKDGYRPMNLLTEKMVEMINDLPQQSIEQRESTITTILQSHYDIEK